MVIRWIHITVSKITYRADSKAEKQRQSSKTIVYAGPKGQQLVLVILLEIPIAQILVPATFQSSKQFSDYKSSWFSNMTFNINCFFPVVFHAALPYKIIFRLLHVSCPPICWMLFRRGFISFWLAVAHYINSYSEPIHVIIIIIIVVVVVLIIIIIVTIIIIIISAVDKPKLMGRPPDHPWWKTGSPKSFFGCPNYFDWSLKRYLFFSYQHKIGMFSI